MILNLYKEIGEILSPISEINWIDLDKGQLDNQSQFESLLCPAILINFEDGIEWQELARKKQIGDAVISIKTIVTLPESTHIKPLPVLDPISLEIENTVHNTIILTSGITRLKTKAYYVGTYYVVEHIYSIPYGYEPNPQYSIKHLNNPPEINTEIKLPISS